MDNNDLPILAIECSSPWLSLALQTPEHTFSLQQEGSRKHSQFIIPEIKSLLQHANLKLSDIKKIVVGNGPGSFIGVRLAHAVAQALCLPNNTPLQTLSSLQIIAQSVYLNTQDESILVAQDARKEEVYACAFQLKNGYMQAITEEELLSPPGLQNLYSKLAENQFNITLVGTGWQAYQEQLNIKDTVINLDDLTLATGALALSHVIQSNLQNEPNYVRNHVADLPKIL